MRTLHLLAGLVGLALDVAKAAIGRPPVYQYEVRLDGETFDDAPSEPQPYGRVTVGGVEVPARAVQSVRVRCEHPHADRYASGGHEYCGAEGCGKRLEKIGGES
jgi:hypothetical protein